MRKAAFFDRDGVINVEKNYVYKIEDFEFTAGVFEVLKRFQDLGYLLFIITNQAGIGRGYYTEADFQSLTQWMLAELERQHIRIAKVYHSPYHPEHGIGAYRQDSPCRKPNPGMINRARDEYGLDLSRCYLVGDKETDIEAGRRAGVAVNILVRQPSDAPQHERGTNATYQISDLREVLRLLG